MSKGMIGASTPAVPALTGQYTNRQNHLAADQYRQGLSHSHTLPHGLSKHHSFIVREKAERVTETERKYGTLGPQPREHPPAYHVLPRASYLLIPQDTPDLLSDTKIQEDTARHSLSQSMGKVNMGDMEKGEEEDIYQSTKF